jgi:hypothetical protein
MRRAMAAPAAPPGACHAMRSSSVEPGAPEGDVSSVIRCACVQLANGPWICSSTNPWPRTQSRCRETHFTRNGPTGTDRVTREPSSRPPVRLSTRMRSHGGVRRSRAPGRACQSHSVAADTGMCDR